MIKKIAGILVTMLCAGFASESYALSMVVDARDQGFILTPPDIRKADACSMSVDPQSPTIIFDTGAVGAVHIQVPLPIELIRNGAYASCQVQGADKMRLNLTFKLSKIDNSPLATVKVNYSVDFNVVNGQRELKRVNYGYTVLMDGKVSRNKLVFSCNDPQDSTGCPGMNEMNLPNEFQYNPFDPVAFKYFPYSMVVHVKTLG